MAYKTCENCGSRVFNHGCVNCDEMEYVSMQEGYTGTEEVAKNLRKPCVMFSLPELEKLITSRIKDAFDNGYQNYEKKELLNALETIKRLVPPDYFSGNGT